MSESASDDRVIPSEPVQPVAPGEVAASSEVAAPAVSVDPEPDQERVKIGYGDGGVPLYVGLIWVAFIISYFVFMAIFALPDFLSWFSA